MRRTRPDPIRPTSDDERKGLKLISHRTMRRIGAANFAPDTRLVESKLSDQVSPAEQHMKTFLAIDVVADLERLLGYPWISEHLVQMQGFSIVAQGGSPADEPDMADVAALSDVQGALFSMSIKALIDGDIDPREARDILPVAERMKAQLEDYIRGLKAALT